MFHNRFSKLFDKWFNKRSSGPLSRAFVFLVGFIFFGFFLSLSPSRAQAVLDAPTTTCRLEFQVKGTDIQILLGYSKLRGKGKIECFDPSGAREERPIKVTIGTPLLFPRISFAPSLVVRGRAEKIKILKGGPQVLLGSYNTLDVRAALVAGAAAIVALEGEDNGILINLNLHDVEGFGLAAGGTVVTFE